MHTSPLYIYISRNVMEAVKVLTIVDLLQRSRPLTATSSFHSPPLTRPPRRPIPPPSSIPNHVPQPSDQPSTTGGPTNQNPNPRILAPLNHPAILIGTLTLPTHGDSSASDPSLRCSTNSCFIFSDDSSTICCDILDFDVRIVGKKVHVLSWNFIPFKRGGGFLEIIRWSFPDSISVIGRCSNVDLFPLVLDSFPSCNEASKARSWVRGALESISPVSVVPCTLGTSTSGSDAGSDIGGSRNTSGFLVLIKVCDCKLCKSKESVMDLHDSIQGRSSHPLTKVVIVYFCGTASSWHPVISKLIGKIVFLSGLKKKLVFMGKKDSRLMYVTTEKAFLRLPRLPNRWLPYRKTVIEGKGECGVYTGFVKGIYMQGMVVELDEEVWLLLTERLLTPPHSLRVGSLISVRNVHFVNPKFSGMKMLILGACFKTSINVESFSPLETGCHMVSESQSLLGKFIESLAFSARLWALLVVSCFRRKFDGILSEKEILGSKHMVVRCYQKEGLAQMFASSHLPSSVFRSRHGVFTELCKHDTCGCGSEPNYGHLKLAVPMSDFVHHCEATWKKRVLHMERDFKIMGNNNPFSLQSCEGKSCDRSIRRIFSSEDIGIVLLGSLKISSSSGRLQLIDATGSIDVVIPDLPSIWDVNSIYEVNDYSLVMEGIPEQADHSGLLESFSCRSIFYSFPLAREMNLDIYVHFHLQNATCKNLLFHPCMDWKDDFKELDSGTFHLLQITHKFPVLQKFQGDSVLSNRSSMFAEAIVLPWDLFLAGKDGSTHPATVSKDELQKFMKHHDSRNFQEHVSCKRCKIDHASSRAFCSGSADDLNAANDESCGHLNNCSSPCRICSGESKHCNLSSPLEVPCLTSIRSVNDHSLVGSGLLYCTKANVKVSVGCKPSSWNVLLEFKSENFFKYQLLRIGGYYITKHLEEDLFCNLKAAKYVSSAKVLITSRTHLWSLSFSSDGFLSYTDTLHDPPLVESSITNNEVLSGGSHEIELQLQRSASKCLETCSDVVLHFSAEVDLKVLGEGLIKPAVTLEEVANAFQCIGAPMTASVQSPATAESDCLLPEGNLISLHGHVVEVHTYDHSSLDAHLSHESLCDVLQLSFFQGVVSSVCIHLLMNDHIVRILGTLSKHDYPIGFGPGVNATFHRILQSSGQNDFMLMPVSHIVVNSVRVVNDQYSRESSSLRSASNLYDVASLDSVSTGLISELIQCLAGKAVRFHCRVLAVHILVLEENDKKYDNPQSKCHTKPPVLNIPLAGFVLDDGSSLCCCWANAERAATLLRLHEEIPQSAFGSSCLRLKGIGMDKACRTAIHYVDRIVKKHGRITVKNYGSMYDSSCQDITFSVSSDNAFSSSDEKLLKFIILNACCGTIWTVLGSVMNVDAVGRLKKHLTEMELTVHSMQNIWAREVFCTSPLTEARNMIQELLNG